MFKNNIEKVIYTTAFILSDLLFGAVCILLFWEILIIPFFPNVIALTFSQSLIIRLVFGLLKIYLNHKD